MLLVRCNMKLLCTFSIIYFFTVQRLFGLKDTVAVRNLHAADEIKEILERLKSAENQIQELKQAKSVQCHSEKNPVVNNTSKRYLSNANAAVGFTACLSVLGDVKHAGDQTIVFDKVFTNAGLGYSSHTGMFTAPRRGLYVFHLAAMASAGTSKYLDIVKDGHEIDHAYVGAHGVIDYQSVAKEWVLELNQGSQVWIKDGTINGDVIDGWCKTAFSGFMVSEM